MSPDKKPTPPESAPTFQENQPETSKPASKGQLAASTRDIIQAQIADLRKTDQPVEITGLTIPPGQISYGDLITPNTTPEQIEIIRAIYLERIKSSELYVFQEKDDVHYVFKTAAGDFIDIAEGGTPFNTQGYVGSPFSTVHEATAYNIAIYLEGLQAQDVELTPDILERPEWQMIATENPEIIATLHVGLASDSNIGSTILEWGTNDAIYGYIRRNDLVKETVARDKKAYLKAVFKLLRKRDPDRARVVEEVMKGNSNDIDQLREVIDLMLDVEKFKNALGMECDETKGSKARKRSSGRSHLATLNGYEKVSLYPHLFEQAIREALRVKLNESPIRTEAEGGSTITFFQTMLKRVYLEKIEGPSGVEWNLIPARLADNKE